jgi:FkbM family methyltransferase
MARLAAAIAALLVAGGQAACGQPAKETLAASPPALADTARQVTVSCPVRGDFKSETSTYYSQFYEDYALAYVFAGVTSGVYVDVGANDPDQASVTKRLYLTGWSGVNIEPNPELLAAFATRRSRDENVGLGIGDAPGVLRFYRFTRDASGLSTFDPAIARAHRKAGFRYDEFDVRVTTLTDVLDRSPRVNGAFDLLNVDVEGFERQVLRGLGFNKYPPAVVVVEATAPRTEQPTQHLWQDVILDAGYVFAMDDGLNRYYVGRAAHALQQRFIEADFCVRLDKASKGINLDGFLDHTSR